MTIEELIAELEQMSRMPSYRARHRAAAQLAARELRRFYPPPRPPEHDPDAITRRERLG